MSEKTENKKRKALIESAGRLIAEKGDPRLVGTRQIVAKAHASKSAVDYYFKNKAGLVNAVYQEVRTIYDRAVITDYLASHRSLLATRAGQAELLRGTIDVYYSFFKSLSRDCWRSRLCIRFLKNNPSASKDILQDHFTSQIMALHEVCKSISGRDDIRETYASYECYFTPIAARFLSSYDRNTMGRAFSLPGDYEEYYLHYCKEQFVRQWCGDSGRN